MNVERLNEAARLLKEDYERSDMITSLRGLVDALENSVSNPDDETAADSVMEASQSLENVLSNASVDMLPPSFQGIYDIIGARGKFGSSLLERISNILDDTNMLPKKTLNAMNELLEEIDTYYNQLAGLLESLEFFGISYEPLNISEVEIGVRMPEERISEHIDDLMDELNTFDRIFTVVGEVCGDTVEEGMKVRQVESSGFGLYFSSSLNFGICFATILKNIAELYDKLIKYKKTRNVLEKMSTPRALKSLEEDEKDFAESVLQQNMESIFREFYLDDDKSRVDELRSYLLWVLWKLAEYIDNGIDIEVRASISAEDEESASPKLLERINENGRALISVNRMDTPRVDFPRVFDAVRNGMPDSES